MSLGEEQQQDLDSLRRTAELLLRLADRNEAKHPAATVATSSLPSIAGHSRASRAVPPSPRLIRRILRQRQMRGKFFDPHLFADPAWDMMLDLAAARAEHRQVSVTSLCIASGVPPTTALRWIGQMVEQGLFVRVGDQSDRRRAFIALSDQSADAMARYFAETGANVHL